MKYMISWFERPQGSPAEYENAQKRLLERLGFSPASHEEYVNGQVEPDELLMQREIQRT